MNKEVQDALYCLLNIALENDKYESQREKFNIVDDYITNLEQKIDKAIEYINKTQMGEGYKKMLLEILGSDKE